VSPEAVVGGLDIGDYYQPYDKQRELPTNPHCTSPIV
jgi:hypothetical protein